MHMPPATAVGEEAEGTTGGMGAVAVATVAADTAGDMTEDMGVEEAMAEVLLPCRPFALTCEACLASRGHIPAVQNSGSSQTAAGSGNCEWVLLRWHLIAFVNGRRPQQGLAS